MSKRIDETNNSFNIITDILQTLRFRGSIFYRSELVAPWGVAFPAIGLPRFHIALSNDFFLGVDDGPPISVEHMSIIMLPNGEAHWMADQPGRTLTPSDQGCLLQHLSTQEGDRRNRIMCGIIHYDQTATHPFLQSLPETLYFPSFTPTDPVWMLTVLIDAEIQQTGSNKGPVVDRLTEALFLKLFNRCIEENVEETGFISALRDKRIHHALTLMHQQPETQWTLLSLSDYIGMSRATFARYFQDIVGTSPMSYLTSWRLTKAYSLIKYKDTSLEQIADSVGFSSARTLNKAFQRMYDMTPNELRKKNTVNSSASENS